MKAMNFLKYTSRVEKEQFSGYSFLSLQDPKKGDCNGDGKIDCIDFAYMHRLGGYGCKDPSMNSTDFYKRFDTCWRVVQAALPKESSTVS